MHFRWLKITLESFKWACIREFIILFFLCNIRSIYTFIRIDIINFSLYWVVMYLYLRNKKTLRQKIKYFGVCAMKCPSVFNTRDHYVAKKFMCCVGLLFFPCCHQKWYFAFFYKFKYRIKDSRFALIENDKYILLEYHVIENCYLNIIKGSYYKAYFLCIKEI